MKNAFRIVAGAIVALVLSASLATAQFVDQRVWGGTSGGTANAQTLTIPNMPTTYIIGVPVRFLPGTGLTNTGPTTLAINGGLAKSVFKPTAAGPTALSGGEIIQNQALELIWDGTEFQITSNTNASAAQIKVEPQGYLTPCPTVASPPTGCTAGILAPTGDVTVGVGQTVTGIFYTPGPKGNQIPIWNGSNMIVTSFTELTLTLASSHIANTIYDVCVFNNSGTPTVVTGPAWSSSAAGSGNRGTGASTAQIARVQGVWTNAVVINGINGATTYSNIPANQCTYVGSIYMDGTNGVLSGQVTYGQNRKRGWWNAYNRLPVILKIGDSTSNWNGPNGAFQPLHNSTNNKLTFFEGLQEEPVTIEFTQQSTPNNSSEVQVGIGINSTTAASGYAGENGSPAANPVIGNGIARFEVTTPGLGITNATALEAGTSTSNTLFGGEVSSMMSARWGG